MLSMMLEKLLTTQLFDDARARASARKRARARALSTMIKSMKMAMMVTMMVTMMMLRGYILHSSNAKNET